MKQSPNVVFILTDDQGYGDLACHGNKKIKTPHIDKLHSESIRFTDFHVGTTCAPTRAGLLTGHYCNSTGVWHTIGGRSLLREDEWTIAQAFKESGYRTGHFGKWHLGDAQPFRPHERGFEKSVYHGGGGIGNTPDSWGNDYFDDTYFVNGEPVSFKGYCTDVFFREGMQFIEEHKDEPFFCYIATNAPHGPLNVENHYTELYLDEAPNESRARFYGMVTNIDENVGLLRDKLEALGLSENTIVVFMTDNGSCGGVDLDKDDHVDEKDYNHNSGMRGKKGSPYEGGHRVPFILHCPLECIKLDRDIKELTSYVDFMPTILDLCQIKPPSDRVFHGLSLKDRIDEKEQPELQNRIVVSDTQRQAHPIKWRLSSVMKENWRLVNGNELYDLSVDPAQKNNIIDQKPDLLPSLKAAYEEWWDLVSEQYHRDTPFALGETEETVILTTHDIRNEASDAVWNQTQVRSGESVNGYWAVDIRRAGRYRIELRRWDRSTGYNLTQGIEGDDSGWRKDCIRDCHKRSYEDGVALEIKWARLHLCNESHYTDVNANAAEVSFVLDCPVGETQLSAAFYANQKAFAPYYIYVTLLNE